MSSQHSDKSAGRQGGQYRKHDKMRSELTAKWDRQGIERKSELAAQLGSLVAEESYAEEFLRKVEERRKKKSTKKKEQELERREKDLEGKEKLNRDSNEEKRGRVGEEIDRAGSTREK